MISPYREEFVLEDFPPGQGSGFMVKRSQHRGESYFLGYVIPLGDGNWHIDFTVIRDTGITHIGNGIQSVREAKAWFMNNLPSKRVADSGGDNIDYLGDITR